MASPSYVITDLGTLPGYELGYARRINDVGQIVGVCEQLDHDASTAPHATLWSLGSALDLGDLMSGGSQSYGSQSYGRDINNAGQVVGSSGVTDTNHSFLGLRAFLWSMGQIHELVAFPSDVPHYHSNARAIPRTVAAR